MWTRAELKSLAKQALKGNYLKAFLVSLVLAIFTGGGNGGRSSASEQASDYVSQNPDVLIIGIAMIILAIAFRIFLGYSLEVGSQKYFVQIGQFQSAYGYYSFAFDSYNYKGIISTMLLKGIYNFLWSLLFVIPGIVKAYSYRMVPYILSDNPNMGADKAITLSRKMMDGNKLDTFILDLSFIGWYLLGALAFGIGILFVNPYAYATSAQLYLNLRRTALDKNYCSYEDLNLPRPMYDNNDNTGNDNYNDYNNNKSNNDSNNDFNNIRSYKSDEDYLNRNNKYDDK